MDAEKRALPIVNIISKPKIVTSRYYDLDISIEHTDTSFANPFPLCLILLRPELIGTHELTKPEGLAGIDYSNGWHGAPIAVANPLNDRLIDDLGTGIHVVESGVDYGDFGVLDGHHRREMAERCALRRVITQLFPLTNPQVVIDTWLENFTPLTPNEVAEYFKKPDAHVPAKATKFQIIDTLNRIQRILHMQPIVHAPKSFLNR